MYKSMHKYEKIAPYIHAHEVSRVSNMVPGHTSMRVTGLYQCTQEWRAIANKVQGRKSIWDCPLTSTIHTPWPMNTLFTHARTHTGGGVLQHLLLCEWAFHKCILIRSTSFSSLNSFKTPSHLASLMQQPQLLIAFVGQSQFSFRLWSLLGLPCSGRMAQHPGTYKQYRSHLIGSLKKTSNEVAA